MNQYIYGHEKENTQQILTTSSDDETNFPLCVDLDGTLIDSDIAVISLFSLLKKNIFFFFLLPLWVCRGKAFLKHKISEHVDIDPGCLPYRQDILQYLQKQHALGTVIILCTGSTMRYASQVSDYLGFFTDVIASDSTRNILGKNKAKTLQKKYGVKQFDYMGDSYRDLNIWPQARQAIIVSSSQILIRLAKRNSNVVKIFPVPH
jgi:phosphoserine phosphatase